MEKDENAVLSLEAFQIEDVRTINDVLTRDTETRPTGEHVYSCCCCTG